MRRAAPAPGSVAPPTRSPEGAPRASVPDPPRHEQGRSRTRLVTRSRRSPVAPHAGNGLPPAASWEDHILPPTEPAESPAEAPLTPAQLPELAHVDTTLTGEVAGR